MVSRKGALGGSVGAGSVRGMQPQDLGLTIFACHLRGKDQAAWSGGMVALLGEFGFSTEAARAALSRLATRALIERTKLGRRVFYRLTQRAEEILAEGDRRIFNFGRAPAAITRWTVLWHSLPEARRTERGQLGRRLRFLGFGSVQDATWVAPHDREADVVAVLRNLDITDYAYLLVGRPCRLLNGDPVLSQAWNLEEVTRRYEQFVEEFGSLTSRRFQRQLSDRDAFVVRMRATHAFRAFPFLDPELPDSLMPSPQIRPRAVEIFHHVYDGLADAAARHFARTAGATAHDQAAVPVVTAST